MNTYQWLLSPDSRTLDFETLFTECCQRLRAEGIPLWKAATSLRTQHPEVFVHHFKWEHEDPLLSILRPHSLRDSETYRASPIFGLYRRDFDTLRVDLTGDDLPFAVCNELAAAGGTDYLLMGLDYGTGQRSFVSFTSNAPGGFTEADIATLQALRDVFALRNALAAQRFASECLLRVYLGEHAAHKVIGGNFLRGNTEQIEAVIWFADMRGFTARSQRLPAPELIQQLDQYFDALVRPIQAHGGEVLKFIGDAVLAIFPLQTTDDATKPSAVPDICQQALRAAQEALRNVKALPDDIAAGIGLHIGPLTFGNVGATGRLDFTVIGREVNQASRIEGLCKVLKHDLILSEHFVRVGNIANAHSLGSHTLRGIETPVEVFGLPPEKGEWFNGSSILDCSMGKRSYGFSPQCPPRKTDHLLPPVKRRSRTKNTGAPLW